MSVKSKKEECAQDDVKRDCNQYILCLTDIDWRPSHCKGCLQYIPVQICPMCGGVGKIKVTT